jgi:APA family basic amino acid/polyamine antiporter
MGEVAATGEATLKRTLGPMSLVALGIGAIIGAGLFVRTAAAIRRARRPIVTLAFLVAGLGCAFAGLCYAEFASMIPIAGSAYTYSYATMGEFVAWIIGWDLCLEYAVGAATVSIAWSEYFNKVLEYVGMHVPYEWCHSPLEVSPEGVNGIMNVPACSSFSSCPLLLIRGMQESAFVNSLIVITKVAIVLMVIAIGWGFMNPANHTPYIPSPTTYTTPQGVTHPYGGIMGILGAAGVVFFAVHRLRRGVDSRAGSQEPEARHADRHPRIAGRLHRALRAVLARAERRGDVEDFRTAGKEASVAFAISKYMIGYEWLSKFVTIAILAGFSSVILVMLMGQSRVFFSMSHDGLVPKIFSEVHPKYQTPWKANMLFFVFTAAFAAFLPESIVGEMTSIGTLFAFMLVCAGVWIMRVKRPELVRGFTVPALPLVAILGIVVCGAMIYGLGWTNWLRLIVWLGIGLVFYFGYGMKHSRLQTHPNEAGR